MEGLLLKAPGCGEVCGWSGVLCDTGQEVGSVSDSPSLKGAGITRRQECGRYHQDRFCTMEARVQGCQWWGTLSSGSQQGSPGQQAAVSRGTGMAATRAQESFVEQSVLSPSLG